MGAFPVARSREILELRFLLNEMRWMDNGAPANLGGGDHVVKHLVKEHASDEVPGDPDSIEGRMDANEALGGGIRSKFDGGSGRQATMTFAPPGDQEVEPATEVALIEAAVDG